MRWCEDMTHIPARPTTYKGIQMRSRLEADYAAYLDRRDCTWEYEPVCFASDEGQWLPDFLRPGKTRMFQEIKSAHLLKREEDETSFLFVVNRVDSILKRMTIAWQSDPDACLQLIFWTYEASCPVLSISGYRTDVWIVEGPNGIPLLWPGMGQSVALLDALHGDQWRMKSSEAEVLEPITLIRIENEPSICTYMAIRAAEATDFLADRHPETICVAQSLPWDTLPGIEPHVTGAIDPGMVITLGTTENGEWINWYLPAPPPPVPTTPPSPRCGATTERTDTETASCTLSPGHPYQHAAPQAITRLPETHRLADRPRVAAWLRWDSTTTDVTQAPKPKVILRPRKVKPPRRP